MFVWIFFASFVDRLLDVGTGRKWSGLERAGLFDSTIDGVFFLMMGNAQI